MLKVYRLPGMMDGEQIVKILRKDLFILFKKVMAFAILIILPYIFFRFITGIFPNLMVGDISYPAIMLSGSVFYLFIWLFFFFSFIDYYLDVWVITSKRVIDVRQNGFFARTISELELEKIQDTTSEVKGVFPTIFKYGNLFIQSAGEKERFVFQDVPCPDEVRDVIIKLISTNKEVKNES
jgi:hypothetical protein